MTRLGIYIHVPFCRSKCPYCDFYSVAGAQTLVDEYFGKLREEISFFGRQFGPRYAVETVFFGGGTPSFVPASAIARTLKYLAGRFHLVQNAEITLEMNPAGAEVAKLRDYRAMGINRISLGVQSFRDEDLRFLGRVHDARQAHAAVRSVQKAGFNNFNLDLLFAVPGQTPASWKHTLQEALFFNPPHLATYNLTYEEGTPLTQYKEKGTVQPISEDAQLKMYKHAIEGLTDKGLVHYEISNFALPGRECRHNLAYWSGQDYLGLGAGAHSFINGRRFGKKRDLRHYLAATSAQSVDVIPDEDLSRERRFWEILAIGLRKLRGVDVNVLAAQWGIAVEDTVRPKLHPWIREGFLEWVNEYLKLSPKGLAFHDLVARSLI